MHWTQADEAAHVALGSQQKQASCSSSFASSCRTFVSSGKFCRKCPFINRISAPSAVTCTIRYAEAFGRVEDADVVSAWYLPASEHS